MKIRKKVKIDDRGKNFKLLHPGYSNTYLIDLLACQRLLIRLVLRKMRFFPMIILLLLGRVYVVARYEVFFVVII